MQEREHDQQPAGAPQAAHAQWDRARPRWRKPAAIGATALTAVAVALTAGIILGRNGNSSPQGAAVNTSPSVAHSSPAAPASAPATSECTTFAQVYNNQVGPALKAPSGGAGNVFWTQQADAFQALADVLTTGTDPYSQTLATDTAAVVASDRQYDADGSAFGAMNTFMTDLTPFLTQCNMH
jgi:hypothetical protein